MKEQFLPESSWDPRNLPFYTNSVLQIKQKTVEDILDFAWGKLVGTNGQAVFSRLSLVVYRRIFTPDAMHLVDENTPGLCLSHWMGVFGVKEITAAGLPEEKGTTKGRHQ